MHTTVARPCSAWILSAALICFPCIGLCDVIFYQTVDEEFWSPADPSYAVVQTPDTSQGFEGGLAFSPRGSTSGEMRTFAIGRPEPFTEIATGIESLNFASISGADFNNDGLLDFFLAGINNAKQTNHLFQGIDFGRFIPGTNLFSEIVPRIVAWADYDGDGDLDLVMAGHQSTNSATLIFRNDQAAGFTRLETSFTRFKFTTGPEGTFAWGDYDNDGDLDLFAAGEDTLGEFTGRLYRNDGHDTFTDSGVIFPGFSRAVAAWADYDNDGYIDLIISGKTTSEPEGATMLFRNQRDGTFARVPVDFPGAYSGSVSWGDFDNDGLLDLLITGTSSNAPVSMIFRNGGTDGFSKIELDPSVSPGRIGAWVDLNHDRKLDLVIFGNTYSGIYTNTGGSFFNIGATLPKVGTASPTLGDFDKDGTPDVLLAGVKNSAGKTVYFVSLFHNNLEGSNVPPTAPTQLEVETRGDVTMLSWTPASDPGLTNGVTYNVRVGRSPGAQDILSAQADPNTGTRLLSAIGNAGERLNYLLRKLTPGTYYWSVQAIDNSLLASPFATEQHFGIEVPSEQQSPILLEPRLSPSGSLQFTISTAEPAVIIDTTENFQDWHPVATNSGINGFSTYTDPSSDKRKFYRVRLP